MINLYKNYKYDNKYDYIKLFGSKSEQNSYFSSLDQIIIYEESYTKENKGTILIDYPLDYLVNEGINYIKFNNGYKDIYAFISQKDYISDDCTRITYEIDVLQTYLFDFTIDKSFIERKVCTLDEITEYDEGIEIGEHIVEYETKVIDKNYTFFAMFNGFKDYHINEDNSINEINMFDETSPKTTIDGITYPLLFVALEDEYINSIFKNYMINLPNLVGVIRLPNCTYSKGNFALPVLKINGGKIIKSYLGTQYVATNITSQSVSSSGVSIPKNTLTDFYPYTYYVVSDGETEPLILKPQYLSGSLSVTGKFALSHTPVERYYPNYYKGSTNGHIYNITNCSNMFLPTGRNGGIETLSANLSQIENSNSNAINNALFSVAKTGLSVASGSVTAPINAIESVESVNNAIDTVQSNMARLNDIELTPSSIKSFGTPSTRTAFDNDNVRIIKYTIKDIYKQRLNNFIDRYGNKYNNYGYIDLKSYKGYIKMVAPDIDGKLDTMFTNKIINILERGIKIE